MQKNLSQKSRKLFAEINTFMTTKFIFIRTTFRLVITGTVWHLFQFKNGPLKIKNSKIRARHSAVQWGDI